MTRKLRAGSLLKVGLFWRNHILVAISSTARIISVSVHNLGVDFLGGKGSRTYGY